MAQDLRFIHYVELSMYLMEYYQKVATIRILYIKLQMESPNFLNDERNSISAANEPWLTSDGSLPSHRFLEGDSQGGNGAAIAIAGGGVVGGILLMVCLLKRKKAK